MGNFTLFWIKPDDFCLVNASLSVKFQLDLKCYETGNPCTFLSEVPSASHTHLSNVVVAGFSFLLQAFVKCKLLGSMKRFPYKIPCCLLIEVRPSDLILCFSTNLHVSPLHFPHSGVALCSIIKTVLSTQSFGRDENCLRTSGMREMRRWGARHARCIKLGSEEWWLGDGVTAARCVVGGENGSSTALSREMDTRLP